MSGFPRPTSGVAPATVLIAETVLAVDTAAITFSSIPQTYRTLELVLMGRNNGAAGGIAVACRINGISTATYDWQQYQAAGVAVTGAEVFATTALRIGRFPDQTALRPGMIVAWFPNYTDAVQHKVCRALAQSPDGLTTGLLRLFDFMSGNRAATPISELSVFPDSGSFEAGTVATLYGLEAA